MDLPITDVIFGLLNNFPINEEVTVYTWLGSILTDAIQLDYLLTFKLLEEYLYSALDLSLIFLTFHLSFE